MRTRRVLVLATLLVLVLATPLGLWLSGRWRDLRPAGGAGPDVTAESATPAHGDLPAAADPLRKSEPAIPTEVGPVPNVGGIAGRRPTVAGQRPPESSRFQEAAGGSREGRLPGPSGPSTGDTGTRLDGTATNLDGTATNLDGAAGPDGGLPGGPGDSGVEEAVAALEPGPPSASGRWPLLGVPVGSTSGSTSPGGPAGGYPGGFAFAGGDQPSTASKPGPSAGDPPSPVASVAEPPPAGWEVPALIILAITLALGGLMAPWREDGAQ